MNKTTKKSIFILVFGSFLICLGIGLVIPVTPSIKNTYGFTNSQMGFMTSLFALAQFIASPFIGRLSDNIGRKPLIVTGLIIFGLSELIFAVSNTLSIFYLARIIGGISAAMFQPISFAMAADLTDKAHRAKVVGWLSASFSGGLILGPGIGGLLAQMGVKVPFYFAGLLGIISSIFTLIQLKEPAKDTKRKIEYEELKENVGLKKILNLPLIVLLTMILIAAFGLQGFESIYSIYVNQVFNFSLNNIALVLTLNGIISLIFQVVLFDPLVRKMGEIKLIGVCFLISSIFVFWITKAHLKLEVIIATLVIFTAFDILRPAITTLLTKFGKNNQGLINGLNMSLTSVGNVLGPIMAGSLMDYNTHIPYLVDAIILFISFFITILIAKVLKKDPAK